MHVFIVISILLVAVICDARAYPARTDAQHPIPVVELVRSPDVRSTIDTVDAVIRCVLHDAGDAVALRLGAKAERGATSRDVDAVEHRLRIDEVLTDWIIVERGYHRLSGLKQGIYNLRVQARYHGQEWGTEVRIHLLVERRQPVPWLLYGLLATLAIPSAYYGRLWMRRRAAAKQEAYDRVRADERRRIARDLHDDVGTGLARIVVLSDAAAAADGTNESAATIAETAREVIDRVRTIVWVMKAENDSASATLSYVRERVADLLHDHGITFHFNADLPSDCALNEKVRWNVMMCIKETATNIVRHSKANNVWMHVTCSKGYISVRMTDDGVGFDTDNVRAGGGLTNLRERMAEIGGTAGIGSREDEGTNILLVVPAEPNVA